MFKGVFYEENKKEEFIDYIKYFSSQYYAEELSLINSEELNINYLYLNGYIRSEYFQNLYKELEEDIKEDKIVIYSEFTEEDIYKVEYIEKN